MVCDLSSSVNPSSSSPADKIKVTLIRKQQTPAITLARRPAEAEPVVTLSEAMLQPWNFDGHVQCVTSPKWNPYRGARGSLDFGPIVRWVRSFHMIDYDPPKEIVREVSLGNRQAPAWWHAEMQKKLNAIAAVFPGILVTRTWKGYRAVFLLSRTPEITKDSYDQVHQDAVALSCYLERVFGLEYDRAATSPFHLFRVPRAIREDGRDTRGFEPLFGSTLGVVDLPVEEIDRNEAASRVGGQKRKTKDREGLGGEKTLIDLDAGGSPSRHAFGLSLLSALGRLCSADGTYLSPRRHLHSSNTDGTSATKLVRGCFKDLHASGGTHEEQRDLLLTEYVCGGPLPTMHVASYSDLGAAELISRSGSAPTLYVLAGPTGAGKTRGVAAKFAGAPALVVSPTIALAKQNAATFGLPFYQDVTARELDSGVCSTTIDSLHRFSMPIYRGSMPQQMFLDEAGALVRTIFGGTQMKAKTSHMNWGALRAMLRPGQVVIGADATFTATDAALYQLLCPGIQIIRVLAVDAEKRFSGHRLHDLDSAAACDHRVLELLRDRKRVGVVTTSAEYARLLHGMLTTLGWKVGVLMGGLSTEEELDLSKAHELDVIILSPAAAKGFSVTTPVDSVVGHFPYDPKGTTRGLGAPTIIQLLGRFRCIESGDIYAHINNVPSEAAALGDVYNPESALSEADQRAGYTLGFDVSLHKAHSLVRCREVLEGFECANTVRAYLASEGIQLAGRYDGQPDKPTRAAREERVDAQQQMMAREVAAAPHLPEVPKSKPATRADRLAKEKAEVSHALGREATAEDILEYEAGAHRTGAALASVYLMKRRPEAVARRDRARSPNVLKFNDVARAQLTQRLLTECGLKDALRPGVLPAPVSVRYLTAAAHNFREANLQEIVRLQLPAGRSCLDMLARHLARIGLRLRRDKATQTYTIAADSWALAWKWALPAAQRLVEESTPPAMHGVEDWHREVA